MKPIERLVLWLSFIAVTVAVLWLIIIPFLGMLIEAIAAGVAVVILTVAGVI